MSGEERSEGSDKAGELDLGEGLAQHNRAQGCGDEWGKQDKQGGCGHGKLPDASEPQGVREQPPDQPEPQVAGRRSASEVSRFSSHSSGPLSCNRHPGRDRLD